MVASLVEIAPRPHLAVCGLSPARRRLPVTWMQTERAPIGACVAIMRVIMTHRPLSLTGPRRWTGLFARLTCRGSSHYRFLDTAEQWPVICPTSSLHGSMAINLSSDLCLVGRFVSLLATKRPREPTPHAWHRYHFSRVRLEVQGPCRWIIP